MKNLSLMTLVGILAFLLGGCPSSKQPEQSQQITQEVTPSPSPVASPSQKPTFDRATQPGTSPRQPSVAGLIPATDPDIQRSEINKGRSDPFVPIAITPKIIVTETATSSGSATVPPSSTVRQTSTGTPSTRTRTTVTVKQKPASPSRASRVASRVPPPPPEPTEALDVVVSGIVQLPTTPVAIVKAPGEATVRRVIPGSTLSNGQVLVKAISTNPDNPYIVLEQYGQTVTKRLGEGIEPPAPENTQALMRLN